MTGRPSAAGRAASRGGRSDRGAAGPCDMETLEKDLFEALTLGDRPRAEKAVQAAGKAPPDPKTAQLKLARNLHDMGAFLSNKAQFKQAAEAYSLAAAIHSNHLGEEDPRVADSSHDNLGNVHFRQGKVRTAQKEYREALKIREAELPPNHPDLGMTYKSMAVVSAKQRSHKSAVQYYEKARAVFQAAYGPDNFQIARLLRGQAGSLRALGEGRSAARLEERAKAIEAKTGGQCRAPPPGSESRPCRP